VGDRMGGVEIGSANALGLGLYDDFGGAAIDWYWTSVLGKLLRQIQGPERTRYFMSNSMPFL
jgi:hypothetical protein